MSFFERLKTERKRLKLRQVDLAALAGVTAQSQIQYEKGRMRPGADYLGAIARAGVDVVYVLTGERGGVCLNPEEVEFLALFRQAAPAVRATACEVLRSGMVITKQVHVGRDKLGNITI